MLDIKMEVDSKCGLGEGPLWDDRTGILWWVDIRGSKLHSLEISTGKHIDRKLDVPMTSIVKRQAGGFAGTLWNGIVLLDDEAKQIDKVTTVEPNFPNNRFNDGKVDPMGRLWAGTMDDDIKEPNGTLYCWDDGVLKIKDKNYIVTNGPTFSPDGSILYHTDTIGRTIYRFSLNDDGSISNKELFAIIPEDEGLPDGMTVDLDGNLYVGHYFGWRITRFSPNGRKIDHIPMPVSCVTSCTFGGENLNTLYITTAAENVITDEQKAKEPHAGALFSLKLDATGLNSFAYKG